MTKSRMMSMLLRRRLAMPIAVVFAILGTALITGGRAAVPQSIADISLAPANVAVKKGDVINIAVNANTNGESVARLDVVVQYPLASLELVSAQYVCPEPFNRDASDASVSNPGIVKIGCANAKGASGNYTLATLVFTALSDTSDAALTISDASSLVRMSDDKKLSGQRHDALVKLQPHNLSAAKVPRPERHYKTRSACPLPSPGQHRCNTLQAVDSNDQPLATANAVAGGYGPAEIHTAYQLPCTPGGPVAAVCATPATYGPLIAIVDAGNYATGAAGLEADLKTYNQNYGIAACTVASGCLSIVNQSGGSSLPADRGWSNEISLDVETAHMVCQTCRIVLVESNDTGASMVTAHAYAASLKPITISDSWSGGNDPIAAFQNFGLAQVIADGDDGVITAENRPADFSEVIVASGTTLKLNTDGTRASEVLWSRSGGGCSPSIGAPAWQTRLSNWGTAGCGSKRGYGDLAVVADPQTGVAINSRGAWVISGGTSLSAPLIAGIFALANGSTANLPTNRYASQGVYDNYQTNPGNFIDVASGSNCTTAVKQHCTAGANYDVSSGLGIPKLAALRTVAATPTPTPTPSPTPGNSDINGDGRVNITDLSVMLSAWNKSTASADLNKNGKVDLPDLSILLTHWQG